MPSHQVLNKRENPQQTRLPQRGQLSCPQSGYGCCLFSESASQEPGKAGHFPSRGFGFKYNLPDRPTDSSLIPPSRHRPHNIFFLEIMFALLFINTWNFQKKTISLRSQDSFTIISSNRRPWPGTRQELNTYLFHRNSLGQSKNDDGINSTGESEKN